MNPIVIVNDKMLDRLSWSFKITGLALFPFIILRRSMLEHEDYERLITHETIHFKQAVELLVIGFYLLYLLNWLINIAYYRNVTDAYRNIVFEKEAYANDGNQLYLKNRKVFSWLNYFLKQTKV